VRRELWRAFGALLVFTGVPGLLAGFLVIGHGVDVMHDWVWLLGAGIVVVSALMLLAGIFILLGKRFANPFAKPSSSS
jgi:hypothetical protein